MLIPEPNNEVADFMDPLPLDPEYVPTTDELRVSMQKLAAFAQRTQETINTIVEPNAPWSAVARITGRSESSAHVWSRANQSRIACARASKKHWEEIRRSGLWRDTGSYFLRRARVLCSVARFYLAALLYTFKFQGVFDLRRDEKLLAAWCS